MMFVAHLRGRALQNLLRLATARGSVAWLYDGAAAVTILVLGWRSAQFCARQPLRSGLTALERKTFRDLPDLSMLEKKFEFYRLIFPEGKID